MRLISVSPFPAPIKFVRAVAVNIYWRYIREEIQRLLLGTHRASLVDCYNVKRQLLYALTAAIAFISARFRCHGPKRQMPRDNIESKYIWQIKKQQSTTSESLTPLSGFRQYSPLGLSSPRWLVRWRRKDTLAEAPGGGGKPR